MAVSWKSQKSGKQNFTPSATHRKIFSHWKIPGIVSQILTWTSSMVWHFIRANVKVIIWLYFSEKSWKLRNCEIISITVLIWWDLSLIEVTYCAKSLLPHCCMSFKRSTNGEYKNEGKLTWIFNFQRIGPELQRCRHFKLLERVDLPLLLYLSLFIIVKV